MVRRPFKMKSLALSRFGYLPVARIACSAVGATASPRSDRDLPHYLVIGVKAVNLENFSLTAPASNVGVDCPNPGGDRCYGTPRLKHASLGVTP
jgi:hypothetical protein